MERKNERYLKIVGAAPVEDFSEEISELTESEKQTVTEIGCKCSEIRNRYHFRRREKDVGNGTVRDRRSKPESRSRTLSLSWWKG